LVVITLVFPDPAPAKISRGFPVCSTARRCSGFRSSIYEGNEESAPPLMAYHNKLHGNMHIPVKRSAPLETIVVSFVKWWYNTLMSLFQIKEASL